MILRWTLAALGGAWLATVAGALAAAMTAGPALAGIAVGVMVSVIVWVGFALGVMATQRLLPFATLAGVGALLASSFALWKLVS